MRHFVVVCLIAALSGCGERVAVQAEEWIEVGAGEFPMGTPAAESCRETGDYKETLHTVTLTRSIEVQKTEVTQGQFEQLLGYNPSTYPACGANCPVDRVSWFEAAAYCNALSAREGLTTCYECTGAGQSVDCQPKATYAGGAFYDCLGYRLPTEAEWEYACRAGTDTAFYSGGVSNCTGYDARASKIGWYKANSGATMHIAGSKEPNALGLHDLSGGVWEWTHDFLTTDLGTAPQVDPWGPSTGFSHMLRGGSIEVTPQFLRCGSRYNNVPANQNFRHLGFRCVRTLPPKATS
jgi:formylglycine-generating enzyme required for sulfatase activity